MGGNASGPRPISCEGGPIQKQIRETDRSLLCSRCSGQGRLELRRSYVRDKKVVVVMPAYNAENTPRQAYAEVLAQDCVDSIIAKRYLPPLDNLKP